MGCPATNSTGFVIGNLTNNMVFTHYFSEWINFKIKLAWLGQELVKEHSMLSEILAFQ